jgi:flagellar basal-body rod modification protein FlgD
MTSAIAPTIPSPGGTNQLQSSKKQLKVEDFIKMMVTQLQNQDPMEPAKNEALLAQMSQIGQLQSSQTLQESLRTLVLQNNLGAAGNMIGKVVKGLDTQGEEVTGLVNSVRVERDSIFLELDNGKRLDMSRVIQIAPGRSPAPVVGA